MSEPLFRALCVKAGAAIGALQACETRERQAGHAAAADVIRAAHVDLQRTVTAAVDDWRPAIPESEVPY